MAKLDIIPKLPDGALRVRLGWLLGLGVIQIGLYAAFTDLSWRFIAQTNPKDHLLGSALGLLSVAFFLYLGAFWILQGGERIDAPMATKQAYSRWALAIIIVIGLVSRLILWASHPIQEIDIYRYLWDGQVAAEGVAPYRYSPADVDRFGDDPQAAPELRRLASLRDRTASLKTIFARIQHREVPTINPPLSQTVFALAALLTPDQAPVSTHIQVLKGLLLLFDIATLFLLLALLRDLGQPGSLLLVYAWCPLVLKEFANSGHMDSIAVCLLTATLLLVLRTSRPGWKSREISDEAESLGFVTGLVFGAATLAKLYPLLLLPLFMRWWWRRLGKRMLFPISGWLLVLGAVYGPLLFQHYTERAVLARARSVEESATKLDARHPLEGLGVFLTRWEMNDFLFAIISGNLRADLPAEKEAWFVVLPRSWRQHLVHGAGDALRGVGFPVRKADEAALTARLVVAAILAIILGWLALRPWPSDGRLTFLRSIFLALAWIWFLNPAQNPWYWCWAMPLIAFMSRPWLLISGLTLMYYLRPWLMYQHPGPSLWGHYSGAAFFDQFVVVAEHLPALLVLLGTTLRNRELK